MAFKNLTASFKRLAIGDKFKFSSETSGQVYKKISGRRIIKMNPDGTGQTNAPIRYGFGSTSCTLV